MSSKVHNVREAVLGVFGRLQKSAEVNNSTDPVVLRVSDLQTQLGELGFDLPTHQAVFKVCVDLLKSHLDRAYIKGGWSYFPKESETVREQLSAYAQLLELYRQAKVAS